LIENNHFHSTGTGVYFESDGAYWYESGATSDVTIRGNHFDRCKYTGWGEACISGKPRQAVESGRYFHKKLEVTGNRFTMVKEYTELAAVFDNFENVVFKDNIIEGRADIRIQHVGSYDIQDGVDVTVAQE
nr:right-handed parallel beta-helix repeat-containing protein [Clostridia bacterium]